MRRRSGGEARCAVKGCRHVQRWHESRLANRWEIQGCLDRKASRRPREEKPCHGRVMVVGGLACLERVSRVRLSWTMRSVHVHA